ncbi:type I-F CRISPR-associated endoribonuclease Cas6/Csy4 [Vibrio sp. V17_P4S1T151]|uniref:type I-F CRISPR-associated endoribonuclease Cas6/Csy4 n=1 Tax=unclassified Vibrio TaxID=2614977 RepID=UPI000B8E44E6|nr:MULTISPECIES: type I-F CRISPR-associated endoribonuclease Cas6/Csy4 [unclassified Vibrio]OXX41939.1 type I-F CRISPR-associated endoribonuclease Cas6/Csy4 [Vibrio sp. V17_P4S1T151]OXX65253.1 type I-F CRISPR-associated endoribonuclease Cas6/Csy4 [Vibrio sp. V15_P4S5T153]
MKPRFYLDIFVPGGASVVKKVLGKVVRIVHGHLSSNDISSISVGFPKYYESIHPEKSTLGNSLRIVGDKFELNMLSKSPSLFGMEEDFSIEVGKIKEVPESEVIEVIFTRDRSIEKKFKFGYENRVETNSVPFPPYVMLASKSMKTSFPLHVKMKPAEARKDGSYSMYGMSVEGSTFPLF